MKPHLLFFLFSLSGLFFAGCLEDDCRTVRTYMQLDPVYKTETECRAQLAVEGPHHVDAPAKIYAWKQYLFINERLQGILVLDNTNPDAPQPLTFWRLPGNVDFVIRDNYMYADQFMDLVTIDISNVLAPQVVCRAQNTFHLFGNDPEKGYIVGYTQTSVTEELDCKDSHFNASWFIGAGNAIFVESNMFNSVASTTAFGAQSAQSAVDAVVAGIAGSYTRFAQHPDYLYIIDNTSLSTFDVQNPLCPELEQTQQIGWNIETIFPWNEWLFVGSSDAVYIFDNSIPQRPALAQTFQHASGCDPVICDDRHAYVTIRNGLTCEGFVNQLEVIDISTLPNAQLRNTYSLVNPRGLALNNTHLFVCDDGLKVFDKTNSPNLRQVAHFRNIDAYDALMVDPTHLVVIASNGVFQFDVTDPAKPTLVSEL
ncbi:MAG: hypothetical protein SFV52_15780 [Saprospiraceae bacterium]|nr:hypothetical protein [Saprospiraceae bacterium]